MSQSRNKLAMVTTGYLTTYTNTKAIPCGTATEATISNWEHNPEAWHSSGHCNRQRNGFHS